MNGYEKLIIQCEENFIFFTKHLKGLRTTISILEEATSLLKEADPKADLSDFLEMKHFNNYNGYVTIANLDLSVNLKYLVEAQTDWEKIFFIKNSFLIIHETISKLKPIEGKSFIQLKIEEKYPSLLPNLNQLFHEIDTFKTTVNYNKIENTRHYTAGHIEKSLKKYYDTIFKLDGEEAALYISKFISILNLAAELTKNYSILANKEQLEKNRIIKSELLRISDLLEKL